MHRRPKLTGFPVPISWIVSLTAGPIFPATFDSNFLKIFHENLSVIPHECFKHAGFGEIMVCFVCSSVFGLWQWHIFDYVLVDFSSAGELIDHHFGLTH